MDVSEDSAIDSQADKLINFDAPITKLDTMTLDDLNDDDFDPRAGTGDTGDSSDTSDDFNPRGTGVTTSNPRTQSMGTPIIKPPSAVTPSQATPTRILPPPSLPPRDPSKITAAKVPGVANPFSSPASDPFGMSNFSSAKVRVIALIPLILNSYSSLLTLSHHRYHPLEQQTSPSMSWTP